MLSSRFSWTYLSYVCIAASIFATTMAASREQSGSISIENVFTPSGGMGDAQYGRRFVVLSGADRTTSHSPPTSAKVVYTIAQTSPDRWAGQYWQNEPDNWGERPGSDFSAKGITKLTFWARGAAGGEVVEFKSGGISRSDKKYHDSYSATAGRITLSREWRQYVIDLKGMNLSSVIGGFCWVVSADFNPVGPLAFFLDDIRFE